MRYFLIVVMLMFSTAMAEKQVEDQDRNVLIQQKSMQNLKQLATGIMLYADENNGKLPDKMSDIAKYIGGEKVLKSILICPVTKQAYTYNKPVENVNDSNKPSKMKMLYSETKDGIISAYLDGHVEIKKK